MGRWWAPVWCLDGTDHPCSLRRLRRRSEAAIRSSSCDDLLDELTDHNECDDENKEGFLLINHDLRAAEPAMKPTEIGAFGVLHT